MMIDDRRACLVVHSARVANQDQPTSRRAGNTLRGTDGGNGSERIRSMPAAGQPGTFCLARKYRLNGLPRCMGHWELWDGRSCCQVLSIASLAVWKAHEPSPCRVGRHSIQCRYRLSRAGNRHSAGLSAMVMSITIGDLAFELRLSGDPDTAPAPGIVATLARRRAHIAKRIELYAPNAPDEAKVEAAIRYIGYSFDTPTASAGTAFADAFRNSGAMIELADWHIPFALSLDAVAGIAAAAVPDTGLTPSHPVHTGTHNRYVGWSDDVVIAAADLQNAAVFTSDVLTIPARVANGYLWFAVDDDVGYPDSLFYFDEPGN